MKKIIFLVFALIGVASIFVHQVSAQIIASPRPYTRPKQSQLLNYLEPGFPVQTKETPGSIHKGPVINAVVTSLSDLQSGHKDIVVSGSSTGGVYAFTSSGQLLPGWPASTTSDGYGYVAGMPGHIFAGFWNGSLSLINSSGQREWTRKAANFVSSAPAIISFNGKSYAFVGEEDWKIHGYNLTDKTILQGWPVATESGIHSPAVSDIDNDNSPEIIAASGATISGVRLVAYHFDGSLVAGWPVTLQSASVETFPVVGDVDGDGVKDIVVVTRPTVSSSNATVVILQPNGQVKKQFTLPDKISYTTAPALADMDEDGKPEIVIQTNRYIVAVKPDGTILPGFPVSTGSGIIGNSSPVVGDVDGRQGPEIVFTTQNSTDSANGFVHIVNNKGEYILGGPMTLPIGAGAVPAISDIDSDSHNEIVITSNLWMTTSAMKDKVWVFDLSGKTRVAHGSIEWGQFNSNEMHTGEYKPIKK